MPKRGSWRCPVAARLAAMSQWPYPSSNGSGICAASRSNTPAIARRIAAGVAAAQVAKGEHFKEIDRREPGHGEETPGEHGRVHGEERLPEDQRNRHHRGRGQSENRLQKSPRVAHADIGLVAPLLPGPLDAVLGGPHEHAARPGGADERDKRVERHPCTDQLTEERREAGPPGSPAPGLSDYEAD